MWLRWLPVALCLTALALATSSGADVVRVHRQDCAASGSPSIDFDGTNFFVVWTSGRFYNPELVYSGVCGTRVSRAGAVRDPGGFTIAPISEHTGRLNYPSVAFGDQNHLVVWVDQRPEVDIFGSRVSRGGAVLDEAGLRLTSLSGSETHPALAFDGANYLMVWYHHGNSPGMPGEILGVLLTSSGDALRLIHISSRVVNFISVNPVVAFDGTNFLVAWEGLCPGICGARVSPSGSVLDDAEIPISGFGYAADPAVAFDGTNYLVVWSGEGLCVGICAARVSPSGTVLDPGGIPIGRGLYPAVAFAGGNYLVAWLRPTEIAYVHEVYGARVSASGIVLDSPGTRISRGIPGGISEGAGPAVAFDGTNALVVWLGVPECATVCGARVNSAGWVLDPDGIWISTPRPPPNRRCVVPRVVGLRLARAKARIRSFNCRVGRVRRVRSSRPGRVLAQSPRAGRQRPGGTRVNLVVGVRKR